MDKKSCFVQNLIFKDHFQHPAYPVNDITLIGLIFLLLREKERDDEGGGGKK